jgi:hypothetical protein
MSAARLEIVDAFLNMRLRPCDVYAHENAAMKEMIINQILYFPSFALPCVNKAVVICGFVSSFGVCTAWMLTGEGFEAHAHHVLPMQRQLCRSMYVALGAHRMEIEVNTGRKDAEGWAERLGFEFETVLQRAGAHAEDLSVYLWPDERGFEHV